MGRWRIGVAFRVLAALLLIVALAAGLGGFALHTFRTLHHDVRTLAEQRLPTILAAAKLDRQAALLSAQAAALILAKDEGGQETEMMRILDLVDTLERLIADLEDGGVDTGDVATIREVKTGFVDSLHRLNMLVAQRNSLETALEAKLTDVLEGGGAAHGQPAPPPDAAGYRWHREALIALHSLQAAASAERRSDIDREERLLIGSLRQLDDAISLLHPSERVEAFAMRARLAGWADEGEGVIALRRQLLQTRDAIDGTLGRNRALADLLGAASTDLFHAGQSAARGATSAAAERLSTAEVTYGAVLATTALIMILTFLYLRESVILRLRGLQTAMAAHIGGRHAAIPTDGDDEIADMGRNLRFFLDVIAAREEELTENEQLFRTVAVTAPFPLLMLRASDGAILTRNRRAEAWLGLPADGEDTDDGTAPTIADILPDAADREALRAMAPADPAGEGAAPLVDREVRVVSGSGRAGWALLSAAPATVKGEAVVLVGLVDIAARRQAEQAVRESERKYRGLVENLKNHAVFAHDLQGRFTYLSPSAPDVFGHPAEEMARDYTAFMPPDEIPRWQKRQEELMSGRPFTRAYEAAYIRADGSRRTLAVVETTTVDEAGHVTGVEGIAHDVTDQRSYESHLQALVRELEKSNAELANFAYVASHDLREPLRMVNSYLGLLRRRHSHELSDEAREFMTYASEGALRMDRLILDLLEYSRVGRGDRPLVTLDLGAPLEAVRRNLAPAIRESGATVTLPEKTPVILGDRTDLERLFQNLLGNAIKYRHPDRVPEIVVDVAHGPEGWHLTVRDNGIGIPVEQAERIFKIFQRLHARSRYDGNGIGLAVCRKVVEHHGGRIWMEPNDTGEGSTFHVILPDRERAAA
ncbi:ATP-binding protein [Caenispirillum salinarum]|uniref:ATP-binding protein n=1 Tax=Caenispirillum salinarum TaxID=859058 RepID=UPI00384EF8F1